MVKYELSKSFNVGAGKTIQVGGSTGAGSIGYRLQYGRGTRLKIYATPAPGGLGFGLSVELKD